MTTTLPMLETYPMPIDVDRVRLATAIDALVACASTCTECASACLGEPTVAELASCVRTDLDCADICTATARVLARHTGYDGDVTRTLLEACALACRMTADECAGHADRHQHCRICVQVAQTAEVACRELLDLLD